MWNIFKRKIKLYLVFSQSNPEELVTILTKKSDIDEYIERRILLDNYEHYKMWCELKGLDINSLENEKEYVYNHIEYSDDEEINKYTFCMRKVYYSIDNIASSLRMFYNCIPVGCTYEDKNEFIYLKQITDMVKQVKDKHKDE